MDKKLEYILEADKGFVPIIILHMDME